MEDISPCKVAESWGGGHAPCTGVGYPPSYKGAGCWSGGHPPCKGAGCWVAEGTVLARSQGAGVRGYTLLSGGQGLWGGRGRDTWVFFTPPSPITSLGDGPGGQRWSFGSPRRVPGPPPAGLPLPCPELRAAPGGQWTGGAGGARPGPAGAGRPPDNKGNNSSERRRSVAWWWFFFSSRYFFFLVVFPSSTYWKRDSSTRVFVLKGAFSVLPNWRRMRGNACLALGSL